MPARRRPARGCLPAVASRPAASPLCAPPQRARCAAAPHCRLLAQVSSHSWRLREGRAAPRRHPPLPRGESSASAMHQQRAALSLLGPAGPRPNGFPFTCPSAQPPCRPWCASTILARNLCPRPARRLSRRSPDSGCIAYSRACQVNDTTSKTAVIASSPQPRAANKGSGGSIKRAH